MLPNAPKSTGRLSDVCISAFSALKSEQNAFKFPSKSSYAVLLVDGLGAANVRAAQGHARFLNEKLKNGRTIYSGFPTTTASSLTSLATGLRNGVHGVLGYRVLDRSTRRSLNFLNDLDSERDPRRFQSAKTVSELAPLAGVQVTTVGPALYKDSGFTQITMPVANYQAAESIAERFEIAEKLLKSSGNLVYLYIPELDQLAHRFGVASRNWLEICEELDSELRKFSGLIPKTAAAVLTADHGVIDVPISRHIYLDELIPAEELISVGGDPRVPFLYFQDGVVPANWKTKIEASLGKAVWVVDTEELVAAGWLDELGSEAKNVEPDLYLIPKSETVLYHRKFAKAKSLQMIGQHGGISKAEWEVPLVHL